MGEPSGDSPVWSLQLYLRIEHELSAQEAQLVGALQRAGQGNHRGARQDGDAVCFRLILTNQDDFRVVTPAIYITRPLYVPLQT